MISPERWNEWRQTIADFGRMVRRIDEEIGGLSEETRASLHRIEELARQQDERVQAYVHAMGGELRVDLGSNGDYYDDPPSSGVSDSADAMWAASEDEYYKHVGEALMTHCFRCGDEIPREDEIGLCTTCRRYLQNL